MHKMNHSTLLKYKEEYESVSMRDEAVAEMKRRIQQGKEEKRKMRNKKFYQRLATAAVAAALVLVALPNVSGNVAHAMGNIPVLGGLVQAVTFRDYQYEDEKHTADVTVPKVEVDVKDSTDSSVLEGKKSSDEINAEIKKMTDKKVKEFKENLEKEGYQNLTVASEIINTTKDFFTLKLMCSQIAGSGYEENHFYTINLKTGEYMKLADLFKEGSDYITPICENVEKQMRDQMASNDDTKYWVDDEELSDWDFEKITKAADFYVNETGEVVICYNEGDVAPMYMGSVEFVIPEDVLSDIRAK